MRISEADVEYVGKLANLDVPENEKKELAEQLSRIVEHVEQLNTLDVSAVPPTYQVGTNRKHSLREDQVVLRSSGLSGRRLVHLASTSTSDTANAQWTPSGTMWMPAVRW